MGSLIVGLALIVFLFYVLYHVIQMAINSSELASDTRRIKELLEKQAARARQDEADPHDSEPCPGCGTVVSRTAQFCPECGLKLFDS